MKHMEELKEMLTDELDDIVAKGKVTAGDLDAIDKLTHSIKSIETIMAMHDYSHDYMRDGSYEVRRDDMGRYSRGYSRGYSYGKGDMMDELHRLMNDADTEKEREAIRRCIDQMR